MQISPDTDTDGIAWVTLDATIDGHTLTPGLIDALETLVAQWRSSPPSGAVFLSARSDSFLVGRNAEALAGLLDEDAARQLIARGQRLLRAIEQLEFPIVALIRGMCRDAGLELALACRYRVADTSPETSLGFTEIHLGLHPCYGSTARLSDLIGAVPAMDLMASGRVIESHEALKLGLVDRLAGSDELAHAARAIIREDPGRRQPDLRTRLRSSRAVRWLVATLQWSPTTERYAVERYPGRAALERLERGHRGAPAVRQIEAEAASMLELLRSAPSRNMIRSFLLKDRLIRDAPAPGVDLPQRLHVVGAGMIGREVAALFAINGFSVTIVDQRTEAVTEARRALSRQLAAQQVPRDMAEAALARLVADDDDKAIESAQFIIEAVDEDLAVKQSLFASLASRMPADAVLATTSATLAIDQLATALDNPQQLLGLHFFHPVSAMSLVEVIRGQATDEAAMHRARSIVATLGKVCLPVSSAQGSVIWRLLMAYLLAGATIYQRERRELIDSAARFFGMPMGPLEMADSIGLDVVMRHAELMNDSAGFAVPPKLREAVEAGCFGASTGAGFHDWRGGRQVIASLPPGNHDMRAMAADVIEPVMRQAEGCRDEGIIGEADLIDAGAILGFGFPHWTGGPLNYLQQTRAGDLTPLR